MIRLEHLIIAYLDKHPGATGYDITQFLKPKTGHSHQQVYRTLDRMRREGAVKSTPIPHEGKPDGKANHLTNASIVLAYKEGIQTFINKHEHSTFRKGAFNWLITVVDINEGTDKSALYLQYMRLAEKRFRQLGEKEAKEQIAKMAEENQ